MRLGDNLNWKWDFWLVTASCIYVSRYESKDLKHDDTNKVCNFVMENLIAKMFVATLKMLSDTVLEL